MLHAKAYLYRGVEVRWSCDPSLLPEDSKVPAEATLSYPNGLADQLQEVFADKATITDSPFTGLVSRRSPMPAGANPIVWTRSNCNA